MADEAYCVKCKKKVEIKGAKKGVSKNGRKNIQGVCPECGTRVFRFTK